MKTILKNNEKIKNLLKFIVFIIILYIVFNRITWIFRSNSSEAREDIYGFRNQGSVDVVLYAGSNLLRYYQPLEAWHQKGYTSYNYATSSAKADLLKAYIEDSRVSNDATLYVCDIRSFPMVIDTVDDSSLRNWSDSLPVFSPARWDGISSFLFSRKLEGVDILSFYFDIIKYHTNTDCLGSEYQWKYQNLDTIYNVDKGFDPKMGHVPFERPERIYDIGELTSQQEEAVTNLLDYCDSNKLNVLFICCPYIITNSDWLTINAVAEKIIDRGYNYINFNDYYDEIGLDFETDFGDVNHVNYLGAEKYTQFLMDYLSENYNLPDHRGDSNYAQWDSDYETFTKSQNEWKSATVSLVDNHLSAKILGLKLSEENDFYEWYSAIRNSNFTVVTRINDVPDNVSMRSPMYSFMNGYTIDSSKNTYIGVWRGENVIMSSSDEICIETNIGVDGGRGTDLCNVSIEKGTINIGGMNYVAAESSIQVVVYDNNYKKVVDNVNIIVNADDSVSLQRH